MGVCMSMLAVVAALTTVSTASADPTASCPGPIEGYWQPVSLDGVPPYPGSGTKFQCGRMVSTSSPGAGGRAETVEDANYEIRGEDVIVTLSGVATTSSWGDMPAPGSGPMIEKTTPGQRMATYRVIPECLPVSAVPKGSSMMRDTSGTRRCLIGRRVNNEE